MQAIVAEINLNPTDVSTHQKLNRSRHENSTILEFSNSVGYNLVLKVLAWVSSLVCLAGEWLPFE